MLRTTSLFIFIRQRSTKLIMEHIIYISTTLLERRLFMFIYYSRVRITLLLFVFPAEYMYLCVIKVFLKNIYQWTCIEWWDHFDYVIVNCLEILRLFKFSFQKDRTIPDANFKGLSVQVTYQNAVSIKILDILKYVPVLSCLVFFIKNCIRHFTYWVKHCSY